MTTEIWETLSPEEQKNYVDFHEKAYSDDVKHAEDVLLEHPRWSIISSYSRCTT
ncbi:MAG TPA: hypothetical protein VJK72_05485 [Candidatus Nanoarchaeia archaeon]|nr:hypothetical protein [Candidatus Nanoarchaeia archaeon]